MKEKLQSLSAALILLGVGILIGGFIVSQQIRMANIETSQRTIVESANKTIEALQVQVNELKKTAVTVSTPDKKKG